LADKINLGEVSFDVVADKSKVKTQLNDIQNDAKKSAADIEAAFKKAKLDFDNKLAKMKISELRDLRNKLQNDFQRKIEMNVSGRSLDVTRQKLSSVQSALSGVGTESNGLGGKLLDMTSRFTGLDTSMIKTLGVVGVFALGIKKSVEFIKEAISESVNYQHEINEVSKVMGFSIEDTQALDYMMKKEGKTIDDLNQGLSIMTGNLGAAEDPTSKQAKLFDKLGISIHDNVTGELRDGAGVFYDIIDALSKETNETQRNYEAKQIFGRSWIAVAKILNGGKESIEAAKNAMREFGVEVNSKQIEDYMKAQADLKMSWLGLKQSLVDGGVIQAIIDVNEAMAKFIRLRPQITMVGLVPTVTFNPSGRFKTQHGASRDLGPDPLNLFDRTGVNPVPGSSIPTGADLKKILDDQKREQQQRMEALKAYYDAVGSMDRAAAEKFKTQYIDMKVQAEWEASGKTIDREKYRTALTLEMNKAALDHYREFLNKQRSEEEKETKWELDAIKTREERLKSYYDTVKFYDKNYRNYIMNEANKKAKELNLNPKQTTTLLQETNDNLAKDYGESPNFVGPKFPKEKDLNKNIMDISKAWDTSMQSVTEAIGTDFDNMWKRAFGEGGNAFERMVNQMTGSFLKAVMEMEIQARAADLFKKLGGGSGKFGVSDILGIGAGIFSMLLGGATGGSFVGTGSGVKKVASFADGGSFMVPPGYPSDSFPMFVQTGERVNVTPSGRAGDEAALLSKILSATKAQTMTLALMGSRVNKLEVSAGSMNGRDIQLVVEKEQRITSRYRG
jgi:hypothetical protein